MSWKSTQRGLLDLPVSLQWLRRSFENFYHGQASLYFKRQDGELDEIFCEAGINQGDSASSLFFNVGLMATWCQLREEYPEAALTKYLDDLNGFIDDPDVLVDVCEPRAESFPGAYEIPDPFDPSGQAVINRAKVPIAFAIIKRWEFLTSTQTDLKAGEKKRGFTSVATVIDPPHFPGLRGADPKNLCIAPSRCWRYLK